MRESDILITRHITRHITHTITRPPQLAMQHGLKTPESGRMEHWSGPTSAADPAAR